MQKVSKCQQLLCDFETERKSTLQKLRFATNNTGGFPGSGTSRRPVWSGPPQTPRAGSGRGADGGGETADSQGLAEAPSVFSSTWRGWYVYAK